MTVIKQYNPTSTQWETILVGEKGDPGPPGPSNDYEFYVKDYGAKGDGFTDDTVAIQTAANAASSKGGVIIFSGGTYLFKNVTSGIGVSWRGAGVGSTILKCVTGTTGNWITVSTGTEFSQFHLHGNGTSVVALYLYQAARSMIHHLWIENTGTNTGTAIKVEGTASNLASHANHYSDLNIIGWGGYGIQLLAFAYDSELVNVWIGTCGVGIYATSGAQQLTGCHIWGCSSEGLYLNTGSLSRVVNSYFESNIGVGVRITSDYRGFSLIGCDIWNNAKGAHITSGESARIIGCVFRDNLAEGLLLENHNGAIIEGNVCFNYSGNTPQTYGIREIGTSNYNLIIGNNSLYFKHASNIGIEIAGAQTILLASRSATRYLELVPALVGNDSYTTIDAPSGRARGHQLFTDGKVRWIIRGNNGVESGSNAGTNFEIVAYTDAGAFLATPISIIRSTGQVNIQADMQISDGKNVILGGTNGTKFGTAGTAKIGFYGATPIVRPTVNAAATDATTTQNLVNSIRTALINLGIVI